MKQKVLFTDRLCGLYKGEDPNKRWKTQSRPYCYYRDWIKRSKHIVFIFNFESLTKKVSNQVLQRSVYEFLPRYIEEVPVPIVKVWRVYWHNDQGPNDGVQTSQVLISEEEGMKFYNDLGYAYAKIIVSDFKVIQKYGDGYHIPKCIAIAVRDKDLP